MVIYIHNFYGDLLLSVRVLFDDYIFQRRDYIKRYEFNMGNRSIQLPYDYKPNFEFPNMIIVLNDDVPTKGQLPTVTQMLAGFNLDQTPVLYNQTNETTLLVQEELVNVPMTCTINCESQFQAKEIAVLVRRWLPVNKFISIFSFTSFLEVSKDMLSKTDFDPAVHQISNIYTKLNKRTGEVDYCYSMEYQPMIRMDSISTAIPDSTQRSFQVVVDITYMIQMPLYMFSDVAPAPVESMDIQISGIGAEPISDYPTSKMINYLSQDVQTLKKGYIRRSFLLSDNNVVESVTCSTGVILAHDQVTNTSTDGENIIVTRGVDDYLSITIRNSETQYRIAISAIPTPDGTTIPINDDEFLKIIKNPDDSITVSVCVTKDCITVTFDPTDFPMSADYSYNLINGEYIELDYQDYTVDYTNNSVTFCFLSSVFPNFEPSLTSPLVVQFYLKQSIFPLQIGGVPPHVGLMKVFNITQTTVKMTWSSDEVTTTQVEYGTTTSYGTLSTLKENYTILHQMILRGLTPNTTYHYRVKVKNVIGTEFLSEDYTFTTLV